MLVYKRVYRKENMMKSPIEGWPTYDKFWGPSSACDWCTSPSRRPGCQRFREVSTPPVLGWKDLPRMVWRCAEPAWENKFIEIIDFYCVLFICFFPLGHIVKNDKLDAWTKYIAARTLIRSQSDRERWESIGSLVVFEANVWLGHLLPQPSSDTRFGFDWKLGHPQIQWIMIIFPLVVRWQCFGV